MSQLAFRGIQESLRRKINILLVSTKFESNFKALSTFPSFECLALELPAQLSALITIKYQPPNIHQELHALVAPGITRYEKLPSVLN